MAIDPPPPVGAQLDALTKDRSISMRFAIDRRLPEPRHLQRPVLAASSTARSGSCKNTIVFRRSSLDTSNVK